MPEIYVRRLQRLILGIPQLEICAFPPLKQVDAAKEAIKHIKSPLGDFVAHFRLDDDDAIAVDFIEHLRKQFSLVANLMTSNHRVAFDYNKGLFLSHPRTALLGQLVLRRQWTAGHVIFLPHENSRTIMHFPHQRLDLRMLTITCPEPVMFVRSMNAFNASGTVDFSEQLPELSGENRKTLLQRFNISTDDFFNATRSLY